MDFSQLKEEYEFLAEILKLYDRFDQPVEENDDNQEILSNCDNESLSESDTKGEYVIFCKKISRNLLLLAADVNIIGGNILKVDKKNLKDCYMLYIWMYFEIKKNSINNNITKEIYNKIAKMIISKHKFPCPYINFNEIIHEPEKLIKLYIFNGNAPTFQGMLKDNKMSNDCNLKKYIYECIGIYRDMNIEYCSRGIDTTDKNKNSCDIIGQFNELYSEYIYNEEGITHKFPKLSSSTSIYVIDGCPLEESKYDSYSDEIQTGTPITHGVSTTLGAMAGISSFLALIYKFTPFGNWLRSQYGKGIANRIGENELFYPTTENMNNSSGNTTYNVLYGSVRN